MNIRRFFFTYRSYTPIPLAIVIIVFSNPSWPLFGAGLLLILGGELFRFNAVRYAGGATRTTNVGAPALCTTGPYAHLRNPLYVANMIVYTGIALAAGSEHVLYLLLLTWGFFIVQYALIVSLEEDTLTNLFGADYQEYRTNVPAVFPRLTPWTKQDNYTPKSFKKTLKTEKRTLQNIFLILAVIFIKHWVAGGWFS